MAKRKCGFQIKAGDARMKTIFKTKTAAMKKIRSLKKRGDISKGRIVKASCS